MRMWFGYAKREAKCYGCDNPIVATEIIIRTQTEGAIYDGNVYKYHLGCFVKFIEYWKSTHPYTTINKSTGRPPLGFTEDQRKERQRLFRKKSSLLKKKEHYLKYRLWHQANELDIFLLEIDNQLKAMIEVKEVNKDGA